MSFTSEFNHKIYEKNALRILYAYQPNSLFRDVENKLALRQGFEP